MLKVSLVLFIISALLLGGCSSDVKIKKGDRFEVLETLKEAADIQGDLAYSDGFSCTIPKGAILEVLYNSTSSSFFESRVVEVDGKTDEEYILTTLVPEVIYRKEGFETFSITLDIKYLGKKVKKVIK